MSDATLHAFRSAVLFIGCSVLPSPSQAQPLEELEEVVVSGRQPGPPLWRVTHGDHTLWILPLVSPVPRDMVWEDHRVAAVIADADEVIAEPNVTFDIPRRVLLNPFNAARAVRLVNQLNASPDGTGLADVLPEDLYRRYAAFRSVYFPDDRSIESLRPSVAMERVYRHVFKRERLSDGDFIRKQVQSHVRRSRNLVRTDVSLVHAMQGGYGELSRRARSLAESVHLEREIACFEQRLGVLEHHLGDMKAVANGWAGGSAAVLKNHAGRDNTEACSALLLDSTEGELLRQLDLESRKRWVDAAQAALEKNRSTFAMLPLDQIIGVASLVGQLAARGYAVDEPG